MSEIMAVPASVEKEPEPEKKTDDVLEEVVPVKAEIEEKKEEIKAEPIEASVSASKEEVISIEAEKAKDDPLTRMEIEYAMEAGILESLEKLPPLSQKEKEIAAPSLKSKEEITKATFVGEDTSAPRSFTEWLRAMSSGPFHNYTEIQIGRAHV